MRGITFGIDTALTVRQILFFVIGFLINAPIWYFILCVFGTLGLSWKQKK